VFSADEAEALKLGLLWQYITIADVNERALAKIEKIVGTPSADICELALSKQRLAVDDVLSDMAKNSDKYGALTWFLRNHVSLIKVNDEQVMKLSKCIYDYINFDDVDGWSELSFICHELDDARSGGWSDFETLKKEFLDRISKLIAKNDSHG